MKDNSARSVWMQKSAEVSLSLENNFFVQSVSCSVVSDSLHLMNCSPPASSVHGILQARILEWVAIPFSWDLPNPWIEPESPALQADSLRSEPPGKPILGLEGTRIFLKRVVVLKFFLL